MAQDSPLSRWAGQQVLKNVRFKLSLDDPRSSEEQWMTLQGDRAQLEALQEAVEDYVQQFLEQTSAQFSSAFLVPSQPNPSSPTTHPEVQSGNATSHLYSLSGRVETDLAPVNGSLDDRTHPKFQQRRALVDRSSSLTDAAQTHGIYLQPEGLLKHTLFLGSIADEETGSTLQLSALQLFDLATALDEYAVDAVTLPSLGRSGWLKSPPSWARVAAIAVLAIGLTTSVAKLLDGSSNPQVATSGSQGASSADQRNNQTVPTPSIAPGLQPVPPLSSAQPLPPPPPPGSTTPANPGLPTVTVPQNAPANQTRGSNGNGAASVERPNTPPQIVAKASQSRGEPGTQAEVRLNPEISSAASSRAAASADTNAAPAAPSSSNNTAFDTIPQVAEARSYFQERWQPPEGLSQTLEYTLVLAPDGSIERITPLGLASGDYIDRTGMPLVGEPFVSPIANGRSPKIRIVLTPDGKVQTFLEQ